MLLGIGVVTAVWGLASIIENAYIFLVYKTEPYEQFLYRCFPNLEKLTEEELSHIQKLIGEDPRIRPKHKWIW
jgi:hypothetical protein